MRVPPVREGVDPATTVADFRSAGVQDFVLLWPSVEREDDREGSQLASPVVREVDDQSPRLDRLDKQAGASAVARGV